MSINYFLYWKVTTAKQINIKAVLNPTTHSVCWIFCWIDLLFILWCYTFILHLFVPYLYLGN